MAEGAAARATRTIGECRHCGREVGETTHTRSGYRVDGYVIHTGPTESATFRGDDDTVVAYQRLLRPVREVICVRCHADPALRRRWDDWEYDADV